jgi:formylglycine-generating enzyme required for sulfatase activity
VLGEGNEPVDCVNWDDAKAYVAWLSKKTGKTYRLLSEAEWEYAARAGTTTPFSTGPTITTDQANFNGNFTYTGSRKGQFRANFVSVGSFPANGFGLHDMHGNVEEWVEDCYHYGYNGAPSDGSAWTSGGNCAKRILRGGSWYFFPMHLRSAIRNPEIPVGRISNGLRVARTL